ncbi:uncharacterized protein LOC127812702 [Diospyros lotus]|uniref:uncharacterized protein LOC127812702 n=1 Tax=Diospyros lotus TaxID=55363 RepID=UPI0022560B91|nr:uncharacterized protein LOC127812702 [Diospyros lotus]
MVTYMQGTRPTGQSIPQAPDVINWFQRLSPPVFQGRASADLSESEYWIEQLEKIFDFIECGEWEKVVCATFMLRDEADHWWRTMQRTLPGPTRQGMPVVTWTQFKELFYTKYFPLCKKLEKSREFMNLKQTEDMSVAQHEDSFSWLIKYMPIYNLDEEAKSHKFLDGLRLETQLALCSLGAHTYSEVVMQALTVKSNLVRMNALKTEVQEPEDKNAGRKHHLGVRGGNFKPKSRCPKCQKFHPGRACQSQTQGCYSCGRSDHLPRDCPKGPKCFNCQKIDHLSRDCPQRKQVEQAGVGRGGQEPRQGRVYHLTREDANASLSVIQGTLIFLNTPVQVLIDPGSTHSFISHALIQSLNMKLEDLECPMLVATPLGKQVKTSTGYREGKVELGDSEFALELTSLEIQDFDMILGMDFLSKYKARIDCQTKIVELQNNQGSWEKFRGQESDKKIKWITALKAIKMLENGAYGYLAGVQVENKKMELEETPVVNEFSDVFPEYLPGLPPQREIEFSIEVVPGTNPIYISPYIMAPA